VISSLATNQLADIRRRKNNGMQLPYIIGVTGGSGAGKTYFIQQLVDIFPSQSICLISQDNYYKKIQYVPVDDNGIKNFDDLNAIDIQAFVNDLKDLQRGKTIRLLEYTFNNAAAKPKTIVLLPAPIIVVEGIFAFIFKELIKEFDLKIFIDASEEKRIERRIQRDAVERGYEMEDVLYRYKNHVNPAYEKYILPYREKADIVVDNEVSLDEPLYHLKEMLIGILQKTQNK